jgi:multiple sugar transport system substrate-binding protein
LRLTIGRYYGLLSLLPLLIMISCAGEQTETVTIASGAVGAEGEVTKKHIREFEKLHPEYRVRLMEMPNSTTQRHDMLVTYLSGGLTDLDVISMDVIWPAEFAAAGWIMNLDGYFVESSRDSFLPGTISSCSYQGSVYAVPWFTDAGVLYFRSDILAEEGVEVPATWERFVNVAGELSDQHDMAGYLWQGARYEGLVCNYLERLWSDGGSLFDRNGRVLLGDEPSIEALRQLMSTIGRDGISPQSVTVSMEEETRLAFQMGNALFLRNWPYVWALAQSDDSEIKGQVGVAALPAGDEEKSGVSCLGGWNLAISAHTTKPEASWELVKFLASAKCQKQRILEAGQLPTRRLLYDDQEVLQGNPFLRTMGTVLATARSRPSVPYYAELSEVLQLYLSSALSGASTPEDALNDARREIENIIRRRTAE